MFCFFGHKTCGILAHWPGIKPAPLEREVLTAGPPGKSLGEIIFWKVKPNLSQLLASFLNKIFFLFCSEFPH